MTLPLMEVIGTGEAAEFAARARAGCNALLAALCRYHPDKIPQELKERLREAQKAAPSPLPQPAPEPALKPEPAPVLRFPLGRHPVMLALTAAANHFKLNPYDLITQWHHEKFALARQIAACLLRERGFSYPQIARRFKRDHSTIVHYIQTKAKKIASGKLTEADIEAVEALYLEFRDANAAR